VDELERAWSDADRREAALERLQARVELERGELLASELLVLRALSHGLTEAEAAIVLGWTTDRVHDQAQRARRVLGCKTSLHAVATALRAGVLS
jgi:DNA-binding NarL/FixJ family response regulator